MLLMGCEVTDTRPDNITYIAQIHDGSPEQDALNYNPSYHILSMKQLGQSEQNGKTVFMYEFKMQRNK
jgi:hypothetical protein